MAQSNAIHQAACSLQAGNWSTYLSQVKASYQIYEDEVWAQMAKKHPEPVNIITALTNLSGSDINIVCRWLLPIIGHLTQFQVTEAKQLLDFSERLDPSYRYMVADQLTPHILAEPKLGLELGSHLHSENKQQEQSIFIWAAAFAAGAPKDAAEYVAKLLAGAVETEMRMASILCIHLPTNNEEVQCVFTNLEPTSIEALCAKTAQLGKTAWAALCYLARYSSSATLALKAALDAVIPEAIIEITNSLHQSKLSNTGVTGDTIEELIRRLLTISLHYNNLRPHIDVAIERVIYQKDTRQISLQPIVELDTAEIDVVNAFPNMFEALSNHPTEFSQILTEWLLSPTVNFNSLSSLLSICTNNRELAIFDEDVFSAQTTERRENAALRILSLTHDGPTVCDFCLLIAKMTKIGEERLNLLKLMLENAFLEFPATTEAFLTEKLASLPLVTPEAIIFQKTLAHAVEWRKIFEQLPYRKELRPSDTELQVLQARKRRFNREINKMAKEKSIFASICSTEHLVQGRRFTTHSSHSGPQIMQMAAYSHSIELPFSELADPMGGEIERYSMRRNAR
ncbi:hypothetical protein [Deefgea piscis]|uniref:hypothetical protein n=1 Tax=Deefgea piscis TaxID=2739061 RepID=UPI001C7EE458|nr:hypothetical protein [Deefgea piscis]QZA82255.1 hypothetical protein K4H25_06330 [Deefgea piscis]